MMGWDPGSLQLAILVVLGELDEREQEAAREASGADPASG